MHRLCVCFVLVALSAAAGDAYKKISYLRFRYTSFGIADPERDKKTVDTFQRQLSQVSPFEESTGPAEGLLLSQEEREERIGVLERELGQPLPEEASRADRLRRNTHRSELERLKNRFLPAYSADKATKSPTGQNVIVLVDTVPNGIDVHDGRITATNSSLEIVGQFSVRTKWAEHEEALVKELKLLADIAQANIVILSYAHGDEPQGQCRGAVGLVVRAPNFDPQKVSRGRLPSEI